ncbi:MAG: OmpH family outer membrane protein [Gemmataceae bacterium]
MKRTLISLSLLVALTGVTAAQGPPTTPTAAPTGTGRDVAVFNMAKVQKEFQKWEVYTKQLQAMRTEEAKKLAAIQQQIAEIKTKLENPATPQKDVLEKQGVALGRQLQDLDVEVRRNIDKKSTEYLQTLHDDIRRVVDAVAKANNFGLVMAYPDATTDDERRSPVYFDMKLRPTAAMPFYVSSSNDITEAVILTLNRACPPPAGSGITPASATTAPAPGAGAAGTPKP